MCRGAQATWKKRTLLKRTGEIIRLRADFPVIIETEENPFFLKEAVL